MSTVEQPAARGSTATVVATAAVTVAIGVTAAALGGYLEPPQAAGREPLGADGRSTLTEAPAVTTSVVLVPVAPTAAASPDPRELTPTAGRSVDDDHEDDHDRHRRREREAARHRSDREDDEFDDDD